MNRLKGIIVAFFVGWGVSGYAQKQPLDSVRIPVYTVVEVVPSYKGGQKALRKELKKHIIYTREMHEMEGTIFVKFIVHEDGSTSDFTTVKGLCEVCDANAIEALKKLPRWKPGTHHGKAVKTWWVQPIKIAFGRGI